MYSKKVLIYRKIKVDWKTASAHPNCSLYFHVLRNYKPISFETDSSYVQECMNENVTFSPSNSAAFPFLQGSFTDIEKSLQTIRTSQTRIPIDVTYYHATEDGHLIGLSMKGKYLTIIKLNQRNYTRSKFILTEPASKILILSDDLLVFYVDGAKYQSLLNISERNSVSLMMKFDSILLKVHSFASAQGYVVSFGVIDKSFTILNISGGCGALECLKYIPFAKKPMNPAVLFNSSILIFGYGHFSSSGDLEIWNLKTRSLSEQKVLFCEQDIHQAFAFW